jgi:hypothetical protein
MFFANLLLSYDVRTPLLAASASSTLQTWLLRLSACKRNNPTFGQIMDSSQKKEGRFDNLQVIFVGHGSATGVPWCVAPETFHPASKVVLVASRPVNIQQTGTHKG